MENFPKSLKEFFVTLYNFIMGILKSVKDMVDGIHGKGDTEEEAE